MKYIFNLPSRRILPVIDRLAVSGCFDKEEPFLRALKAAIEAKHEESVLKTFIPLAHNLHGSLLPLIFYNCAINRLYFCVFDILCHDPSIEYEGNNVIHLAVLMDDLILLDTAPLNPIYLHLRNDDGHFPTNNVKSVEMYEKILERSAIKASKLPFPKEHEANLDYLHKSNELGFDSPLKKRLELLFIDPSWFQFDYGLSLKIPRATIFKSSYKQAQYSLLTWYTASFYGKDSYIRFEGEEAIDLDGVTMDWLGSLLEVFFKSNPEGDANNFNAPLFRPVSDDSNIYEPTGFYDASVYKFAGSIIAMALSKGITTRVEFIPSMYRVILDIEPYRVEDLQIQSLTVYRHLNSLKKLFNDNVPLEDYDFKCLQDVEEYIESYSADLLYNNHKKFLKAFADGFRSKIPRKISKYLDLSDLKKCFKRIYYYYYRRF